MTFLVPYNSKIIKSLISRFVILSWPPRLPILLSSKKDVLFELEKLWLDAIENLNTLVTSGPSLKIFDSKLPTRLRIYTSSVGLGTCLKQNHETADNEK